MTHNEDAMENEVHLIPIHPWRGVMDGWTTAWIPLLDARVGLKEKQANSAFLWFVHKCGWQIHRDSHASWANDWRRGGRARHLQSLRQALLQGDVERRKHWRMWDGFTRLPPARG